MDVCDDSEAANTYFKQLTHLVNFRVINLGETQIPNSKYGINLEHLLKRGIHLDLGGLAPLGKPCELIQTVTGMLDCLEHEGDKRGFMDISWPSVLEATCYVYGDEELYKDHAGQRAAWLADPTIHQRRARKRMLEATLAWDDSAPNPSPHIGYLEDEGKIYNVTQEIYRLPAGLLYSLALYHGMVPASGWDAIERLQSCDVISREAAHHLGYALSFANMLRLNGYLRCGQQQSGATMLVDLRPQEAQVAVREAVGLPKEDLQIGSGLFRYYYTALPFQRKMASLFDNQEGLDIHEALSCLAADPCYEDTDQVNGNIHSRLLQWEEAKHCYMQALDKQRHDGATQLALASTLHHLGATCNALREYPKSKDYYTEALEIKQQLYGTIHLSVASTLEGLGTVHRAVGEYSQGVGCYLEALAIRKQIYGDIHPAVASTLDGLGTVYRAASVYPQSVGYYAEALAMLQQVYGDMHPTVAAVLDNLGIVCKCLADYPKSRDYYAKALEIKRQVYGDIHPAVARTLHNLGLAYSALGVYQESIRHYSEAVAIKKQVYGDMHPSIASTFYNLGFIHKDLEKYPQSMGYYTEALMIRRKYYGDSHPAVASTLDGLGIVHSLSKSYAQSTSCLEEALAIRKQFYGDSHLAVARTLHNLGMAYSHLGEFIKSISHLGQALAIMKQVYGEIDPHISMILNCLGMMHRISGEHSQSIDCYLEALVIETQVYGHTHPYVSDTLYNLSMAYSDSGDQVQRLSYLEEALQVRKQVYRDIHPSLAILLQQLGVACYSLGHVKQSIDYHAQALAMYQQLSERDAGHTYVKECVSIAHNLACMYHAETYSAMQEGQDEAAQEYLTKAKETLELAISTIDPPTASLCTEYASFLITMGQVDHAYHHLQQAIAMGDDDRVGLSYGATEKETVTPVLREKIDQDNPISLRPVDYAYYLLIHHYGDFQAAGIHPGKSREAYLGDYRQAVDQQSGQVGKEREDEVARYLLESLEHEMGYQLAAIA